MASAYREIKTVHLLRPGSAGGGSRIRTGDILLAKQTLYQLSYTPEFFVLLRGIAGYGGHPPQLACHP